MINFLLFVKGEGRLTEEKYEHEEERRKAEKIFFILCFRPFLI